MPTVVECFVFVFLLTTLKDLFPWYIANKGYSHADYCLHCSPHPESFLKTALNLSTWASGPRAGGYLQLLACPLFPFLLLWNLIYSSILVGENQTKHSYNFIHPLKKSVSSDCPAFEALIPPIPTSLCLYYLEMLVSPHTPSLLYPWFFFSTDLYV